MKRFTSSILNFGPILTPYRVDVDDNYVVCSRNNGFFSLYLTRSTICLKKKNINNYAIIDNLFWTNVVMVTSSGERVKLRHFSMGDAQEILSLIRS